MFGLGLIRFVPNKLRPSVISLHNRVMDLRLACSLGIMYRARKMGSPQHSAAEAPLTIIGLFGSPSGLGQGARLMWAKQKQLGRVVHAVDCTAALRLPIAEVPQGIHPLAFLDNLPPGPIVIHLNPPLYELMCLRLPRHLRLGARLTAYWAWELERAPQSWARSVRITDEIWVPSDFVANAVRAGLGPGVKVPIHVVPHAVEALPFGLRKTAESTRAARLRHGLPVNAFIVAFSFSMSSNYARKNPMSAVAAFQLAFPRSDRAALLILRFNDREVWPAGYSELLQAAKQDDRILLVDGVSRRIPIGCIYYAADVYLSLHRSEGYGLNIAEAACVGTTVIATGWGLAADIAVRPEVQTVSAGLIPVQDPQGTYTQHGAQWAEPDIEEAAAKLRTLRSQVCACIKISN